LHLVGPQLSGGHCHEALCRRHRNRSFVNDWVTPYASVRAVDAVCDSVRTLINPNRAANSARVPESDAGGGVGDLPGAAAWGIATSIGLFRLRNWARLSILVFSVLLVLMSAPSGLMALLMPFPAPRGADPSFTTVMRVGMGAFWLGLLAIGIWWLVFFNRAKVKFNARHPDRRCLRLRPTYSPIARPKCRRSVLRVP
jgi:hypothetical protein